MGTVAHALPTARQRNAWAASATPPKTKANAGVVLDALDALWGPHQLVPRGDEPTAGEGDDQSKKHQGRPRPGQRTHPLEASDHVGERNGDEGNAPDVTSCNRG